MKENNHHSGFVSIIGRPNVGKSTLLNSLVGEKLAIISNKPQTTRNRIQGVVTRDSLQIIFIDTPGLHRPKHRLGELMVKAARSSVTDADVTLFVVSAPDGLTHDDIQAMESLSGRGPSLLIINKTDAVNKPDILVITEKANALHPFEETIPLSAATGDNLDTLIDTLAARLPIGPKYFPDDHITDQPERFIAAELIREKALYHLRDEIPHGVAVEIMSAKKRDNRDLIDIDATIYCERDSHKAIVIGKNGGVLKRVGAESRPEIERLFGMAVNLQLWVKVKKDWRDNPTLARNLGNLDIK